LKNPVEYKEKKAGVNLGACSKTNRPVTGCRIEMNAWRGKAATGIRTESGLMIAHLVLYQDILIELKA